MKVQNEIQMYEINGQELPVGKSQYMKINSHRIRNRIVNIEIDDKTYSVALGDLEKAIRNATNMLKRVQRRYLEEFNCRATNKA